MPRDILYAALAAIRSFFFRRFGPILPHSFGGRNRSAAGKPRPY